MKFNQMRNLVVTGLMIFGMLFSSWVLASPKLDNFVKQTYIHGVPFQQARALGPGAVPKLIKMLSNKRYEKHWANVVVTLGFIGDNRAVDPMIKFITQSRAATISQNNIVAKRSAVMSLGYIVNKTGNKKAFDFLAKSLEPNIWRTRKVTWRTRLIKPGVRDKSLTKMAVLGLAVTGKKEAADVLKKFKLSAKYKNNKTLYIKNMPQIIDSSIQEHKSIKSQGLLKYYNKVQLIKPQAVPRRVQPTRPQVTPVR